MSLLLQRLTRTPSPNAWASVAETRFVVDVMLKHHNTGQILTVNEMDFSKISHYDAVQFLSAQAGLISYHSRMF